MPQEAVLTATQASTWGELVEGAFINSIRGLSEMVGQEIEASHLQTRSIPVDEVAGLLGEPESPSVGIYLSISGEATGHIVLIYAPETAYGLVEMLLGNPPGTIATLDEMEQSALGELGNVMGSFFLNHLANAAGYILHPSPPAIIMDMASAILEIALADIVVEADRVLAVDAVFGTPDRQIKGHFLVMPSLGLVRKILKGVGQ